MSGAVSPPQGGTPIMIPGSSATPKPQVKTTTPANSSSKAAPAAPKATPPAATAYHQDSFHPQPASRASTSATSTGGTNGVQQAQAPGAKPTLDDVVGA